MTREQRIIAAATQDRGAFNSLATLVEAQDFTRQGWIVWECVANYYVEDGEAESVDMALLVDSFSTLYPRHAKHLELLVSELEEVSAPNVLTDYLILKKNGLKNRIAEALLSEASTDEMIVTLMEEYHALADKGVDEDSNALVSVDIMEVISGVTPDNVVALDPEALNEKIDGGLERGRQVAIYAPTEVGKTLISIHFACALLKQGHTVLYCGNEDPAKAMLLRFYSNLADMDKHEILANPGQARDRAFENGYANLVFLDLSPGSIAEIRRAVEKYEPLAVFVDQMANMECRSENKVEKNEILAARLRALAKKYDIITFIIHQASESAYSKLVLEKNDMYFSNVGVQGQMDLMLGIGSDAWHEQQNRRVMSITKNKISGDHSYFPITVNPSKSQIVA